MSKINKKYFLGDLIPNVNNFDFRNKEIILDSQLGYMFNRTLTMFKYHNLPETIPFEEIEKRLQSVGTCAIFKDDNGNLRVYQYVDSGKLDFYGNMDKITINNGSISLSKEYIKDVDCVICDNDSYKMGLYPMFEYYLSLLTESYVTMNIAVINKRVTQLISASDNNTYSSAVTYLKDIEAGKIGVIAESNFLESLKVNNVTGTKDNNLVDLYQFHQYIKGNLFQELGLNVQNNMKKERLVSTEIEVNATSLYPLIDNMYNSRLEFIEKVNTMFGTNIEVEFNSSWDYRFKNGEMVDTKGGVDVEKVDETITNTENNFPNTETEIIDTTQDTGEDTTQDAGEDTTQDTGEDTTQDTGEDTTQDTGNDTREDTGN